MALPHLCRWGAQWVVAVVERLREVVGIGGGGDEAEVVEKEKICLFTMCM